MPKQKQKISDSDKLLAALSYVWILFVIPFVVGHDKKFVYRHAKQGLALFVFELILIVFGWVPILGWLIAIVGWFFVVITAIIGIAHSLAGKSYEVPFIGKYTIK